MPIRVLALDLERTLISDAMNREPRPGLHDFLAYCLSRFERIALFTSVNRKNALAALEEVAAAGDIPPGFLEKLEYVEWEGKYKDLRHVRGVSPTEVLLIDDDGGWIAPGQEEQWISITEYDPYLVRGEDTEFARVRAVLEARCGFVPPEPE